MSTYRVVVKYWDHHYGDGHTQFRRNFEARRSAKADKEAIDTLENALKTHSNPQGRIAEAWAERSDRGYPSTLRKYDGSSGKWIRVDPIRPASQESTMQERHLGFSELDERRRKKTRLAETNFQQGERVRIRVIGPKGQLADPPFWYTVPSVIDLEELALQFSQTIQPGMFVSISDGKNSWTFQKETHGGQNAIRRTHKLPTARYRENVRTTAPHKGTTGHLARDYIAVDSRGRTLAGPFKGYSDAKHAAGPGGHVEYVRETGTAGVFEVDEAPGVPGASHGLEWHRYKEGFIGTVDGERRFLLDPTADGDWILWHVDTKSGFQDHKIGRYGTAADAKDAARSTPLEPVKRRARPRPKAKRSAARRR